MSSPVYVRLWRNKYLTTDATSLEDMIAGLENAAKELKKLLNTGKVTLREEGVSDDYAFLETTDYEIASEYGFSEDDDFDELEDIDDDSGLDDPGFDDDDDLDDLDTDLHDEK